MSVRAVTIPVVAFLSLWSSACLAEGDTEYSLTPYVWAISIDQQIDNALLSNPINLDTSFGDLLDNLDGAFLVAFKAQRGRWALTSDLAFLKVSPESDSVLLDSNTDASSTIWDALVRYEIVADQFRVGAGMRWVDVDIDVTTSSPIVSDPSLEENYLDFIVAFQYETDLSEQWRLLLGGDVSLGGDTDGMWMGQLLVQYEWTETRSVLFGYRRLELDLDGTGRLGETSTDIDIDGLGIGLRFQF